MQAPSKSAVWSIKPGSYFLPGLKRIRHERQMSIRELAEKAKLGPDTVWRVETLQRGAEPKTRQKLVKALDTKLKDLLTPSDEEEMNTTTN